MILTSGGVRRSRVRRARGLPGGVPDPAFQVVVFPAREPWMTGRLVYCEAFWALDCVGLRDPYLTEIEERFSGS